jgi:hypothetical protein
MYTHLHIKQVHRKGGISSHELRSAYIRTQVYRIPEGPIISHELAFIGEVCEVSSIPARGA